MDIQDRLERNLLILNYHMSSMNDELPTISRPAICKADMMRTMHLDPPGGGGLNLCFGRGLQPGPRHPNPGLNQKVANVYPGGNQISVNIHYIYVAPNYI